MTSPARLSTFVAAQHCGAARHASCMTSRPAQLQTGINLPSLPGAALVDIDFSCVDPTLCGPAGCHPPCTAQGSLSMSSMQSSTWQPSDIQQRMGALSCPIPQPPLW